MTFLKQIMDIVYVETIRAEEGGTYGVSTQASLLREPYNRYAFTIGFDTSNEIGSFGRPGAGRTEKVGDEGPTAAAFDKVKEFLQKSYAQSIRENGYWLGQLTSFYRYGTDSHTEYLKTLNAITPEDIARLAKISDSPNRVEVVMNGIAKQNRITGRTRKCPPFKTKRQTDEVVAKTNDVNKAVEQFTVGRDREMDLFLAEADVLGSLAHTRMLESIGLLGSEDLANVQRELKKHLPGHHGRKIYDRRASKTCTRRSIPADAAHRRRRQKIHSGRSRNDQVLVDLRIFLRRQIRGDRSGRGAVVPPAATTFGKVQRGADAGIHPPADRNAVLVRAVARSLCGKPGGRYRNAARRLPHLQQESLGSAAGYGSSFPLNRTMTTQLLGFDTLSYNVVYAQMGRGKSERIMAQAMSSVAATLARLAMDNTLFLNQNFGFISLSGRVDHRIEHHAAQKKIRTYGN